MTVIQKAVDALNDFVRERQQDLTVANKRGDAGLARVLRDDINRVGGAVYGLQHYGDFELAIETIMEWDTEPRDEALDHFKAHGLKDAVEATGFVTYAK